MVVVGYSHEQNEGQGYDHDKGVRELEYQTFDEGEARDSLVNAYCDGHDPSLDHRVYRLDRQRRQDKFGETSEDDRDWGEDVVKGD